MFASTLRIGILTNWAIEGTHEEGLWTLKRRAVKLYDGIEEGFSKIGWRWLVEK